MRPPKDTTAVMIGTVVGLLLWLAGAVGTVWIVAHFVRKFW